MKIILSYYIKLKFYIEAHKLTVEKNSGINQKYEFIKRNLVISNSKFDIFFDHLITQVGEIVNDFIVIKPKRIDARKVAGICILPMYKNKFYLMKGWRHQFNDFVYQAPTGFIEDNETLIDSAKRELLEETSLICKPKNIVSLGTFLPDAGLLEASVALFLALDCRKSPIKSSQEIGTGNLLGFKLSELKNLINNEGKIGGSTLVTCFRSINYFQNGNL